MKIILNFYRKRVLKKDLPQLNGDIPLYSANVFQPFGFVKESTIDSFDYNYVLWGIDGEFEFNVMEKGRNLPPRIIAVLFG